MVSCSTVSAAQAGRLASYDDESSSDDDDDDDDATGGGSDDDNCSAKENSVPQAEATAASLSDGGAKVI